MSQLNEKSINDNYDFDLIISSEKLKENQQKCLNNQKVIRKRLRLKKWVKVTLLLMLGALIGITIYQLFSIKSITTTPVGTYTCRGGIIKICTSSKEVANYLGV